MDCCVTLGNCFSDLQQQGDPSCMALCTHYTKETPTWLAFRLVSASLPCVLCPYSSFCWLPAYSCAAQTQAAQNTSPRRQKHGNQVVTGRPWQGICRTGVICLQQAMTCVVIRIERGLREDVHLPYTPAACRGETQTCSSYPKRNRCLPSWVSDCAWSTTATRQGQ